MGHAVPGAYNIERRLKDWVVMQLVRWKWSNFDLFPLNVCCYVWFNSSQSFQEIASSLSLFVLVVASRWIKESQQQELGMFEIYLLFILFVLDFGDIVWTSHVMSSEKSSGTWISYLSLNMHVVPVHGTLHANVLKGKFIIILAISSDNMFIHTEALVI